MTTKDTALGISTVLALDYDRAIEHVVAALKEQGFGVLTEIDVKATLKKKLDADFRRYVILGACNPPLAYRALSTDLAIGLLLPCNVIVYENDDRTTTVSAMNPMAIVDMTGHEALREVAEQATAKLQAAVAALSALQTTPA
ncbi:MAG: DUF302 domain-containing protein [Caldilineales bacterium]|nr:DUF302 domain-containing protein [Caldilineales bacterium]MDW8318835.1 DUF302 domain-containing protein [Anaerolineae bacterium]